MEIKCLSYPENCKFDFCNGGDCPKYIPDFVQAGKTTWTWNPETSEIIESYGTARIVVGYAKTVEEWQAWIDKTEETDTREFLE
jgi:hypothetical protein